MLKFNMQSMSKFNIKLKYIINSLKKKFGSKFLKTDLYNSISKLKFFRNVSVYGLSWIYFDIYNYEELPCNIICFIRNTLNYNSHIKYNSSPRIKFQLNDNIELEEENMSSMTISDNPQIIGMVGKISEEGIDYLKRFVVVNKNILLNYWNDKLDDIDFRQQVKFKW